MLYIRVLIKENNECNWQHFKCWKDEKVSCHDNLFPAEYAESDKYDLIFLSL